MSDMYAEACGKGSPELELTVKVLNINKGHNEELATKSELLSGYENFVSLIKSYSKTMSRDKAIDRAIEDCIRRDILKDFLEEHSSEVRSMLLRDLTLKEWRAVDYKDGVDDGIAKGITQGTSQVAKAMKVAGETVSKIMDYTGLSRREIAAL
ncbi:MAG: hypothetical protein FWC26_01415 [Fibromonadales bacterium]|nr:hypothetical protein [Fibromonadales bacterium]